MGFFDTVQFFERNLFHQKVLFNLSPALTSEETFLRAIRAPFLNFSAQPVFLTKLFLDNFCHKKALSRPHGAPLDFFQITCTF